MNSGFQHGLYTLPLGGWNGVIPVCFTDYICSECGYCERYISEPPVLKKIAELSEAGERGWARTAVFKNN